jgi:uncharacterized protein
VLLRVVLLLLMVVGILWFLGARSRERRYKTGQKAREPEAFARCAHCGVHLPINDAVVDRGVAYCSEAHRLAGPRDRGAS